MGKTEKDRMKMRIQKKQRMIVKEKKTSTMLNKTSRR